MSPAAGVQRNAQSPGRGGCGAVLWGDSHAGGAVRYGPGEEDLVSELDRAEEIAAREGGLAVAITTRADGLPRASVVNAGVLRHPDTGDPIVGFVSRGAARKLRDLRERPHATVVFRSGWDWTAVEGIAELVGPADPAAWLAPEHLPGLLRTVYAAAVGGSPDDWGGLDETIAVEGHTAVLLRVVRVYPSGDRGP